MELNNLCVLWVFIFPALAEKAPTASIQNRTDYEKWEEDIKQIVVTELEKRHDTDVKKIEAFVTDLAKKNQQVANESMKYIANKMLMDNMKSLSDKMMSMMIKIIVERRNCFAGMETLEKKQGTYINEKTISFKETVAFGGKYPRIPQFMVAQAGFKGLGGNMDHFVINVKKVYENKAEIEIQAADTIYWCAYSWIACL